ncbi:ESX secretion-associated protein EspG [Nocardia cyriacigeorgica]|uniref:ESX secretion-associated protein EspG n=1 Tax=Nocardia cyriacigeorgica TaxID=135487 RepID=A0A6P1D5N7_9NOCA|nr:ESX secretion-associated protein EspG [Nocardia cyriacigeorgica]NEW40812.1 ESX secretion-associated protein EspG [Nocardia cyriacigeorgica]NEW45946.1 ESX secretion-associated protein EspG [Nocardia cyriacigeorgica]NEW50976.1 ESX secretion-associated protein EspG [Nocardia cyriacigeorgica]NEW55716.1 ESX secretion-associated protein EspG [Nocardia cyriacigeorgica]
MTEWKWDPDDFAALWYSAANDRFPRPLRYISRFAFRGEAAVHREKVRANYDDDQLERIQLAMHTLAESDFRIEIIGGTTRTKRGKEGEYRVVGASTAYQAVVLSQTAVDDVDGAITCRLFRPEHLATRLTALLPSCAPGKQAAATFHLDDLDPSRAPGRSSFAHRSPREEYQRMVLRPADGGGNACLLTGPIHSRPDPWYATQWFDITGDGRYQEHRVRDKISVRPATGATFTEQFSHWIDRARRRLREEAEEAAW